MNIYPLIAAALALLPLQTPAEPSARAPLRGYVQPAGLIVVQPASEERYHRVSPNLSGNTTALAFAAGVSLGRTGIEGEVVLVRDLAAPQRFLYTSSEDYRIHNRDTLLNVLVRLRAGRDMEVVGGGGLVMSTVRRTERTVSRYNSSTGRVDVTPQRDTVQQVTGLTFTAGLDVPVNPESRIVVVPTLRIRMMNRPGPHHDAWTGVRGWAVQFGLGIRPSF
ncbi:MAG TPA: hypothetical protein VM364_06345 [Vicinamibacterales bacterium]|nr:hypothetical protein [Vicinamibacterales bacterium]